MSTSLFDGDLPRQTRLFDSAIVGNAQEAVDFITNILESSTEYAVIGKDLYGKILLWNEGARRLYGYEPEEVVGQANSSILHIPEDVEAGKPQEILEAALREGKWEGTLMRLRKNGQRFTARVVITPRRDASGRAIGFLLISKDISDEIRLTEELRASQYYTRSLIESNIDALMTTDPLGIITDVNQTVVSYNAATFYDRDGKLQGVFAGARDVTERKRFEQTLQEKNVELENASLAKDRFLASMSHELRTPLNAIIGFTGVLLMQLPGPLTPDQDNQLKTVEVSAKHLLSLINDLLDLAKIESGKVELSFEPVACQSVVQEVFTALRPLAESKNLVLEVEVPPHDLVVRTDRRAFSQILINLTNNAIKFTDQGSVRLVLDQDQRNGQELARISIVDTGIGIRQEDQEKLFEAFSQLDVSNTRRHEGTGLGLHLSQKLSTLLGGAITFKSQYGAGSTFTLALPTRQ